MYDPLSPESDDQQTEWVEVQNLGDRPADLGGCQLTSGTRADPHAARQKYVFRDLVIPPHGYAVIAIGPTSCYQSLGLPRIDAYCDESHYAWLTNSGDSIAIRDAENNVIDEVAYTNESPWPITRNGGSIQFIAPPGEDPSTANDDGKNWVASGVSNSEEFEGHGRGTPGGPLKAAAVAATTQPVRK
jgi:hypothetical protein